MKKTNLLFSALLVMVIMLSFSKAQAQDPFITKWTTSNPGYSDTSSIIIPTTGTGYNYDVSWNNDGVWETGFTGDATHDYGVAGTYTVAIRGTFPRIFFNYDFDAQKIISIEQWGDIAWTSMDNAFLGCLNLESNATDAPDLSGVTSLFAMFAFATTFNANLNNWDVSNITDMTSMFLDANNFNGNISSWNVSNVTSMSSMFINCYLFNQDISNWNVSNVTSMASMFAGAGSFNQNIGSWNVSKVMDMYAMFSSAVSFNQNIGSWDVGNVLYMDAMFEYASSFNQNIGNWDVSDVTNMESMFDYASSFNQNIGNWNVGNVLNMNNMFQSASTFNQNIVSTRVTAYFPFYFLPIALPKI